MNEARSVVNRLVCYADGMSFLLYFIFRMKVKSELNAYLQLDD